MTTTVKEMRVHTIGCDDLSHGIEPAKSYLCRDVDEVGGITFFNIEVNGLIMRCKLRECCHLAVRDWIVE